MRYPKLHFARRLGLWLLGGLAGFFAAFGADAPPTKPKADRTKSVPTDAMAPGGFSFHLKPKAFQKDPELDMTVITELTKEGKTQPLATPENPIYYGMHSLGLRTFGYGDPGKLIIPADKLKSMMQTALAQNGYLTAKTPEHPPTLVLVYEWGLHAKLQTDENSDAEIAMLVEKARNGSGAQSPAGFGPNPLSPPGASKEEREADAERFADDVASGLEHSPELRLEWLIMNAAERRNLAERASLVGGEQFAYDLQQVLERTRANTEFVRNQRVYFPDVSGSPLHYLLAMNPKVARLFDQAAYDVYFVTVVAYDFDAYLRGERHALWGTKMTVNTEGVSMQESLPSVISAAAPYFGRPMSEAATLLQPIHRDDDVKIGPLKVIGPESDAASGKEKK